MCTDLNYVEDSAGGPDVTLGILPKLDKVTLLQVSFHVLLFFLYLFCSKPSKLVQEKVKLVFFLLDCWA